MSHTRHAIRCAVLLIALTAAAGGQAATQAEVVDTYADIAEAMYADALAGGEALRHDIEVLLAAPSAQSLAAARESWRQARPPYLQSETFRFGNPVVDDWEPEVNSWPLDEGLIDYVAAGYQPQLGNPGGGLNIVAKTSVQLGRTTLDLTDLTPELLASLNELAGSEANVATGYHAIEFLLWGQDLNGTGPGAGERPYTDYLQGDGCTHGHCARRAAYLAAVAELLVDDLREMTAEWARGGTDNYRAELNALPGNEALVRMFYGMGSLAFGELAGERMQVALEANSPEDEQDCFSDNTHHAHFFDALGIRNVYLGRYRRSNGDVVSGPSLADLVHGKNAALDRQLQAAFEQTQAALQTMVDAADNPDAPMKFDQMIGPQNALGRKIVSDAIAALATETDLLVKAASAIGIARLQPDTAGHSF